MSKITESISIPLLGEAILTQRHDGVDGETRLRVEGSLSLMSTNLEA
jgi:hypothetical protein